MYNSAKVDFVLWKWPKREDGIYPIKMRVTFSDKRKYYGRQFQLDVKVTEKQFDSIQGNPRGENKRIKDFLAECKAKAEDAIKSLGVFGFSFDAFETKLFKKDKSVDLYTALQLYADSVGTIKTSETYNYTLNTLKAFRSKPMKFSGVTVDFMKAFENYVLEERKASSSTFSIHARNIRTVFNQAIEQKLIDSDLSPFGKGRYQIRKSTSSKKLTPFDNVKEMLAIKPGNSFARDMYLLSFFLGGANPIDVFKLRPKDLRGGIVSFIRQKTKNNTLPTIEVPLIDISQSIIDSNRGSKYLLSAFGDHIQSSQQMADRSKKVRRAINSDLKKNFGCVLHEARHSFQTYSTEAGVSGFVINNLVGHKESVTEGYITITPKLKREALEKVKGYMLS